MFRVNQRRSPVSAGPSCGTTFPETSTSVPCRYSESFSLIVASWMCAYRRVRDLLCATAESLALATKSELEIESKLKSEDSAPLETAIAANLQRAASYVQQGEASLSAAPAEI